MFDSLASWTQSVIEQFGPLGVTLLVVLENVFPPIPSEIILPFAGFVAQQGSSSVLGMVLAATVGSTVGASILYTLAAWFGEARVRRFVLRFGRWFTFREADLNRAEAWFNRRSFLAVSVGRCVPLIRSVISLPAGFCKMRLTSYILGTALGSLVWNSLLIGTGAALGSRWDLVEQYVGYFQYITIAVLVAVMVRFYLRHKAIAATRDDTGKVQLDFHDENVPIIASQPRPPFDTIETDLAGRLLTSNGAAATTTEANAATGVDCASLKGADVSEETPW